MMFFKIVISFLFLFALNSAEDYSRKLEIKYNPNFSTNCTEQGLHVVYVRAVSNSNGNDILHYVIAAGVGPPTVLQIASNKPDAKLSFNCANMLSKNIVDRRTGITLNDGKVFSAGFLVSSLWQYNDTKDTAGMDKIDRNTSIWHNYPMETFKWRINSVSEIMKSKTIVLTTNSTVKDEYLDLPEEDISEEDLFASNDTTTSATTSTPTTAPTTNPTTSPTPSPQPDKWNLFRRGGQLALKIVLSATEVRRDAMPRLIFTGNNTQLDVTLNELSSAFNGSRYGLTLVHMSSLHPDKASMDVDLHKSFDDEYTPGIFKILNWRSYPKTSAASTLHDRAFVQWKPVCYTNFDRTLSASQQMYYYKPQHTKADFAIMESSVAFPWFNPSSSTRNMVEALPMNISFGQSGDGFYRATNITEWSFSMGLGSPPIDSVSLLVILLISIGLGIPFGIIIFVLPLVIFRQHRRVAGDSSVYPVIN